MPICICIMKKRIYQTILLPVVICFFHLPAMGQNNPYRIDDRLYGYYERCNRLIQNPKVLFMADTLFQMAVQENDIKAQCLAKNLKSEHYYYTDNFNALTVEKETVASFARNTPYKQYIFGAWNRIISYLLKHREYQNAVREIKEYQQEALQLGVSYAIGHSYVLMGDTYFQQRMYSLAIEQYKQGAEYNRANGKEKENYHLYNNICSCYTDLGNYEEGKAYAQKAIKSAPIPSAKIGPYIGLLRIFIRTHEEGKARLVAGQLMEYRQQGVLKGAQVVNYHITLSRYYQEIGNFNQALLYSDSISDELLRAQAKGGVYAREGHYKEAYEYLKREKELADSLNQSSHAEQIAFQNARFNNQRLVLERNRLGLENAKMELERLHGKERLMILEKEQDRIELENRNLQLEQQNTATALEKEKAEKQRLELVNKEKELQWMRLERTTARQKWMTVITLLSMLAGFSIFYVLMLRQRAGHLRVEKESAEKARLEAERADRLKSAFLANMSHEIRTPLNAIIGFNDLLNDETLELGKEERKELLMQLHVNSNLLLTLVRDVLELSKLESGNYPISIRPTGVSEICRTALATVRLQVQPGVELLLDGTREEITLDTDEQRLRQVLTNLLANACKYTEKGSITLAYKQMENKVIFSVTDTGPGIPKDKAEVIFQRFEKLGSFKPGFGLGLSICQSLLQLLGGNIHLDTTYTGGAKFVVEIHLQTGRSTQKSR